MGFLVAGAIGENVHGARALQVAAQLDGRVTELDGFVDAVVQPWLFLAHGQDGCSEIGVSRVFNAF